MRHIVMGVVNTMVMVLFFMAGSVFADGMIIIPRPPHPPQHRPPHYAFAPLEVRYHNVSVQIKDQVAVTEIDQVFYNPLSAQMEGIYLFPIPRGGEIDRFSMDINGKMVEAELLDAGKARRIYEDIVRSMRDPALLEYTNQGLYRVRIFPIPPRAEKQVKLRYTQILKQDNGLMEYLYPLNTEKFSATPLKSVALKIEVESSQPIQDIYSPSHQIEIRRPSRHRAVIGYEDKEIKPATDFQLFIASQGSQSIGAHLLAFRDPDHSREGHFMLMLSPDADVASAEVLAKDLVFVLDTSGSMAEKEKMNQAREALRYCLRHLNTQDRFEIVRFSTEAEALFNELRPLNARNLDQAEAFVDGLKPIGGTALAEALDLALRPFKNGAREQRPYMVVLITDGKPTVGETGENAILAQVTRRLRDDQVRIFCLGVGSDLNTHLLDRLIAETRAAGEYILPEEDLTAKIAHFFDKINMPVLARPEIKVTGPVRLSKMTPPQLPDIFKGEQLLLLGQYSGSGRAEISLTGRVNGRSENWLFRVQFPEEAVAYDFIPRIWASRRIGFLLDQIRLHGENDELKEEVTILARQYGIVTPYTAYLIIEDETVRRIPSSRRTIVFDDPLLERESGRMYDQVNREKSGDMAVGATQSLAMLKNASQDKAEVQANAYFERGQSGAVAPAAIKVREALQSGVQKSIANQTFYQNNNIWIDARIQAAQAEKAVQIKFASEEYYRLLDLDKNAPQWLSAGRNMQVLLAGKVYEITD